jgi:hypothetical protein
LIAGVDCRSAETKKDHWTVEIFVKAGICVGRRTVTRILWANGREQEPWAAKYFLHSRSPWQPQSLFNALWKEALALGRRMIA